ncbi:NERD domain-containing protein [Leptolyngbya sp. GB1-A1]|uniref:DEAD/DEAH box helicase n=1 Tax=Leptolyngbya sp. GB1-A1 TaxID=2933908 RepID=UPI0032995288
MATLIPAFNSCSQRMTAGERRFAERLQQKLEDDYLLWYDIPIGKKRLHPDFIILQPDRGLFILEVKDWKLDTIQQADRTSITLLTDNGLQSVDHPLEQARKYAFAVKNALERDSLLQQPSGKHQGSLICPYAYGVVFTSITRRQFEGAGLDRVFPAQLVICQDEFYESVDVLQFQQRLWDMSHYDFDYRLTSQQIDRIRWHLFPEIRLTQEQVMDLKQEQLARSLGSGHRIVHGVAGSGKTLVLVYRCQFLAEQMTKPILVLCYNISLAARLRQMMREKGIGDRVRVRHFHGWCADLLRQYGILLPDPNQYAGSAFFQQQVQQVMEAIEAEQIPTGQYGAVLIDEGHDFDPEWLKLAVQMVDPETNSLLLLYDDAQNLKGGQQHRKVSFAPLGIQARGRTTILKINYRNTYEVLTAAYEFAKDFLTPTADAGNDDEPMLILPESAGRHWAKPELIHLSSFRQEMTYLIDRLQKLHSEGVSWNQMAIIYRHRWTAEAIEKAFGRSQISLEWVTKDRRSRNYKPQEDSIKLITMHSSKGLEYRVVCIPALGYVPHQDTELINETRLLYVAMTRAMEQLIMTCHQKSVFVRRLEAALDRVA